MEDRELQALTEQAAEHLARGKRVVIFTGAGISTESGIPDFRGPQGLWRRENPENYTYQRFLSDPDWRKQSWKRFAGGGMAEGAEPNTAHYAVAELDKLGLLDCVITQNIDGLHQRAGVHDDKVIELHGTFKWVKCLDCGARFPREEIKARILAGEETPDCPQCRGMLKTAVIAFGEPMPVWETMEAERRSRACDVCLVIGSSLVVYPAAYMPLFAHQAGAKLIILNQGETPLDSLAHVRIDARAGQTMTMIMDGVKRRLTR